MSSSWDASQTGDDEDQTNSKFTTADVIAANQKLLDAISRCDYATYDELCADDLTAFESESNGMLISGKNFHKYYFDLYGGNDDNKGAQDTTTQINITMSNPHVRWLGGGCCSDGCGDGSAAVISYVRMDQSIDVDESSDNKGSPVTRLSSETRVWENRDGRLVHVHFHKS